jgi:L-ascorbate metabolism protein UlaG (beta-lactamase superfamily)
VLGALSSAELSSELTEGIGEVDVLFVPVSGEGILSASEAGKVAVSLGAKLVIPVSWADVKDAGLQSFLKESAAGQIAPQEKLTLKKKDLDGKEGEVILLEPLSHA